MVLGRKTTHVVIVTLLRALVGSVSRREQRFEGTAESEIGHTAAFFFFVCRARLQCGTVYSFTAATLKIPHPVYDISSSVRAICDYEHACKGGGAKTWLFSEVCCPYLV